MYHSSSKILESRMKPFLSRSDTYSDTHLDLELTYQTHRKYFIRNYAGKLVFFNQPYTVYKYW